MYTIDKIKKDGLQSLQELNITIKDYFDFVLLDYSQLFSPKFDKVVQECRGLILQNETWKPLCRSFDKFYNYGEDPRTNEFPINKALILEKIDGSLIRFWHHPTLGWNAATRKMAFSEGETLKGNRTFRELVELAIGMSISKFAKRNHFNSDFTYCFELTSPETRIITPYQNIELYLIAIRHNEQGFYYPIDKELADIFKVKFPKRYSFSNWKECLDNVNKIETLDEGYVACYSENHGRDEWRIKIKSPKYLELVHVRNNGVLSIPRIIKMVMLGEEDEYLSYFPEDKETINPWIEKREQLEVLCNDTYKKYKDIEDQKEFALKIKDFPYAAILFNMRKNNETYNKALDKIIQKIQGEKATNFLIELLENIGKETT